jgi:integrase
VKLDKREVDSLACPPGRRDMMVMDEDLTGFALRVTKDGTKTFIFQYRLGPAVKRLRLGRYGDITPAQARKLAEIARGAVAAGRDPAGERRATIEADMAARGARKRQAVVDALTLEDLIAQWVKKRLADARPSYRLDAPQQLRRIFKQMLPLPAHTVDARMLRKALEAVVRPVKRKAPAVASQPPSVLAKRQTKAAEPPLPVQMMGQTMARRARVYGHACYAWGMKRGLVAANPFAEVIPEGREVSRDRVLNDAELGEVWRASGALGWPWGPYFRILLLTLQREVETAQMRWDELAPDRGTWQLPGGRTKNRKPHLVHLAEPARAILAAVPRLQGSPLVFTTTGLTAVSGFSHAKVRLDVKIQEARARRAAEAGTEPAALVPWRIHDFRRTGVTALAGLGTRWEVADRLLNHMTGAISGVAAIYQRHEFLEERRQAMDQWAAHVLAVAKIGGPNE